MQQSFRQWKESEYKVLKHDYDLYVERCKHNSIKPQSFEDWLEDTYEALDICLDY